MAAAHLPGSPTAAPAHQLRLAGLFVAITACFLVYSLIQERLMTLGFGPQRERFSHSLFIILVNRLVACAVAAAALALLRTSMQPAAPLALFAVPSAANVLGSASQYEALKYVSFPLQALAKCAKTVPVMAWGLVLGGRKYDATDYICAATVTAGCALFVLTGSIAAPQHHPTRAVAAVALGAIAEGQGGSRSSALAAALGVDGGEGSDSWLMYGLLLLAAFLVFDGLTSTTQDKLFAQYEMHSCSQLLWVSVWSAGISLALLVAGNQLAPALRFVARHPSSLLYILLLSLVSTVVQLFIFYTIQQYGALHFALIMTLRQFLSIVLSCLVFSHDLSASQWLGTLLVIGGLMARGMHRGGLARTSVKTTGAGAALRKVASGGPTALLPLISVPVIDAAAAVAIGAGEAQLGGKADDRKRFRDGIPLDVTAGAAGGGEAKRVQWRGSPTAAKAASGVAPHAATRRKAVEPA